MGARQSNRPNSRGAVRERTTTTVRENSQGLTGHETVVACQATKATARVAASLETSVCHSIAQSKAKSINTFDLSRPSRHSLFASFLCALARNVLHWPRVPNGPYIRRGGGKSAAFSSCTRRPMPERMSKSLGWGESNAGRSGIGTSSIR